MSNRHLRYLLLAATCVVIVLLLGLSLRNLHQTSSSGIDFDIHGKNADEVRIALGEPNAIHRPPQESPLANKEVWEYDHITPKLEHRPFLVYFGPDGKVHRVSTDEHN